MNTELGRLRQIAVQRGDDAALQDAADSIVKLRKRCEELLEAMKKAVPAFESLIKAITKAEGKE